MVKHKNSKIRKKSNAMRQIYDLAKAGETFLISVMGVSHGAGATHLSIMIGNYLANGVGKKVAVVEWSNQNDYDHLWKMINGGDQTMRMFSFCGMDFYRKLEPKQLPYLLSMNYDAVILDSYAYSDYGMDEFIRSSCRIIVADLELWKMNEFIFFLNNHKDLLSNSYHCVSVSYDSVTVNNLERDFQIHIDKIPLERNPFCISGQSLEWFQDLLMVTR